ncbi:SAF domain-containing protein [Nocardioides caeni]|uniref:Pilus assembly protein CpaB n=1 Tax=Nocardioides caeni TaxID=574700 RepID=A0A4S8NIM5_9ACTN|nr:SAF domain-containing protein [Nocardioides caeni]THV14804.1 pilus assembly protein CpaB [Nocardioides caeni]
METRDLRRRWRDRRQQARRRLLRHRHLLALVLTGVAVLATLRTLAPPPPATTVVLVAARDLAAGEVLEAGDLTEAHLPPDLVPAGIASTPVGQTLAGPLRRGEPVTDVRLTGPELATGQPPDTVAQPVRLTDAGQAALLGTGDRIDLIATDPRSGASLALAFDVTVLAVPPTDHASDPALPGRLVLLAVDAGDVLDITAASSTSYVTYTWRRDTKSH